MDINQKLLQRKIAKSKGRLNKVLKTKKKYSQAQKYISQELTEKLQKDPLAEKKQDFYQQLFSGEIQEEPELFPFGKQKYRPLIENQKNTSQSKYPQNYSKEKRINTKGQEIPTPKDKSRPSSVVDQIPKKQYSKSQDQYIEVEQELEPIGKSNRQKKKERDLMKKIYTEKTRRGQPVMKNYINLVVHQLDQQKKNK